MSKKPYYITTAITYTSGKPHIGTRGGARGGLRGGADGRRGDIQQR